MKTIFKYTLLVSAPRIKINGLIKVLSIEEQNDDIVLYALIDTDSTEQSYVDYAIYGTGHSIPDFVLQDFNFFGTVKMVNGALMYHVFIKIYN